MALLLAAEAVEIDAPYEERAVMVDRLSRVPLTDGRLQALRETCVLGYRSLIDGERGQEEVAAALSEAAEESETGNFTDEHRESIEAALERASQAIATAKAPIHQCIEQLQALEVERRGS